MIVAKQNLLFQKTNNVPSKEIKPSNSYRLNTISYSDDPKGNKSLLPPKPMFSPPNNINFPETAKSTKVETVSVAPILRTQKAVLVSKESSNLDGQLRLEGLRQIASRSKETVPVEIEICLSLKNKMRLERLNLKSIEQVCDLF